MVFQHVRNLPPLIETMLQLIDRDQVRAVAADPIPPFSLTEAEEQRIAPLQAVIGRHVDEGIARFLLGERALTQEEITEFKAELEALGLPAFMAFWQEILERGESK